MKIIYKFIVEGHAAARLGEEKKTFSTISRVTFNTLFNIIRVCRLWYVL